MPVEDYGSAESHSVRRSLVLDGRIRGLSATTIARNLGLSLEAVQKDIQSALQALTYVEREQAKTLYLRELESQRMDFVISHMVEGVEKGDPKSAQALIKASELRAKLLGLFVPLKKKDEMIVPAEVIELLSRNGISMNAVLDQIVSVAKAREAASAPPSAQLQSGGSTSFAPPPSVSVPLEESSTPERGARGE